MIRFFNPTSRIFCGAIVLHFSFVNNNIQPHRASIVNNLTLKRKLFVAYTSRSTKSSDSNPTCHNVWDYLDRLVATCLPCSVLQDYSLNDRIYFKMSRKTWLKYASRCSHFRILLKGYLMLY